MLEETTFRILFILTAGTFILIWGYNIWSVGITRDKFYTSTEGVTIATMRFILLGSSGVGIAAYCISPLLMDWSTLSIPLGIRWFGVIIGLIALILLVWVIRSLGRNFSTSLTIRKEQTLVTHGPYHWVRHPMYTGFILLWIGFFFISANWFIALTGISGFALTILVRTPKEEQMMIEHFGEEYLVYMKRTGRYLPRLLGK